MRDFGSADVAGAEKQKGRHGLRRAEGVLMKSRILNYMKHIDELLAGDAPDTDWEEVRKEHLIQVGFFQHERLIHLMVTLAFAIFTFMSLGFLLADFQLMLVILFALLLVLLIPYISHYYLLENGVQYMYKQYDAMTEKLQKKK